MTQCLTKYCQTMIDDIYALAHPLCQNCERTARNGDFRILENKLKDYKDRIIISIFLLIFIGPSIIFSLIKIYFKTNTSWIVIWSPILIMLCLYTAFLIVSGVLIILTFSD